jgi:hypothetical protein
MSDIIFSVDVETAGPRPGIHHLLSIGAAAYDVHGFELDAIELNIAQSSLYTCDADTSKWWATQPSAARALERDQLDLHASMQLFERFIKSLCLPCDAPVFLADPAIFDYPWIDWAFRATGLENPFHFTSKRGLKVIDLDSFACGGLGFQNSGRHEPLNALRVDLPPHTHIAVEDARHQGELFFKIARAIGWPSR